MIRIAHLIHNINLQEAKEKKKEAETTGHMTHIADWSMYGDPMLAYKHAEAMHKFMNGESTPNHTVSVKADGGVSLVVGKKLDGRYFITYKSGKKMFHTPEEIDAAGVPWAEDGKKMLAHAMQMPIQAGHAFQGDLLWADHGEKEKGFIQPNTVKYKPTEHGIGIAVHSQYHVNDNDELTRTTNVPDIKQLKHDNVFVPDLQIKPGQIRLNQERNEKVKHHLDQAMSAMTPEVQEYAKNVFANPKLHKFLQEYSNEVVATTGERSVDSMKTYLHQPLHGARTSYGYMEKSTQRNMSDKARSGLVSELESHMGTHGEHLSALLNHMHHISQAKKHMLDQFHEHAHQMGIVPMHGQKHEGLVSAFGIPQEDGSIKEVSLAKLTEEGIHGFSASNRRRGVERGFTKEREQPHSNVPFVDYTAEEGPKIVKHTTTVEPKQKKVKKLKEEMSVGAGGIAGLGGPEDVAVPVSAQKRYTKKGPMRRKIVESFLNSNNLMK
jgi:hypothetical protein